MDNNKTKLDSLTPTTESAKPDIDLITKINAGQRLGTPNVTNSKDKDPDFIPPTLKDK